MEKLTKLIESLRLTISQIHKRKEFDFPEYLDDELFQFEERVNQEEQFLTLALHDNDKNITKCCMNGIARLNDKDYKFFELLWQERHYLKGKKVLNELEGILLDIWSITEAYQVKEPQINAKDILDSVDIICREFKENELKVLVHGK